jgi:acetyl esterase/lipase
MLTTTIQLWEDRDDAHVECYVLRDSQEFQTGVKRPAVIVCPGGAYLGTSDREAEPVALRFAAAGYHAFVLRYTTYYNGWVTDWQNPPPGNERSAYPRPLLELAKTVALVRRHAEEWRVDPDRIAVAGFSAGGHLAASLGVHWHEAFLREQLGEDNDRFKPNALILGYPVLDYLFMRDELAREQKADHVNLFRLANQAVFGTPEPDEEQLAARSPALHVSDRTPPVFVWHTADDDLVYAQNALNFASACARWKVPYELHVFASGVHGLSLADETTAADPDQINPEAAVWFQLALNWLKKQMKS